MMEPTYLVVFNSVPFEYDIGIGQLMRIIDYMKPGDTMRITRTE